MKTIRIAALTALAIAAPPAAAVQISYGGLPATGGGYTTPLTGPGVSTETFNGTTGSCGVTTGISITGNYQLVTGTQQSYYAAPAGDTTCYLAIPQTGSSGTATVDYSSLLTSGKKSNYFGLYWGSIDNYNILQFYNGSTLVATVNGADVLASAGVAGDQSASGSNRYVNIYFSQFEVFNKVVMTSNGVAFEADNFAIKAVPEPGMLGLLGGAMMATAALRRRKKA